MINSMNKTKMKTATIALLLILAMTSASMLLPSSNAHTPAWEVPTYAYLSVAPNPIGIGQTAFVNFWLNFPPPTAAGAYGDRWKDLKVTVTKPDGTTKILGPYKSDAVGGAWATYAPEQVGNYTFVFSFPGQVIKGENPNPVFGTSNAAAVNDTYLASTSVPVVLTVQQEQIVSPPENPLPTGYWQRPVESVNSEWYKISGNWLGLAASTFAVTGMYNASGNFNPYTTAPNTAHIVWTKQMAFGGLIGGEFGGSQTSNYYSTSQYEPKFAPIIMNGILYYVQWPGSFTHPAGWVAVDIRTGQTLWTKTNTTDILRCGQTLNYISPNQYGGLAYLWSIPISATGFGFFGSLNYTMWDALTGNKILTVVGGVPMTLTEGADGSLIGYFINATGTRRLVMWNSTEAILYPSGHITENWMWRPALNSEVNFSRGIMWERPIATNISGVPISPGLAISKIASDVVLMLNPPTTITGSSYWQPGWQIEAAYSAKDGRLLWGPLNRTELPWTRIYMGPAGWGVYTEYDGETMRWNGYSLTTGEQLWGPTEPDSNAWSYYGCQFVPAYGNLYTWDFGGHVKAYNMQTGEKLWSWNTGSSGYQTPYGVWTLWTFTVGSVADGKLFVPEGHMYSPPLFHGAKQWAIDTTTGEPVWSIMSFDVTSGPAIADGYMVTLNAYDNRIYCYGKGQTLTTVSAPQTAAVSGHAVTITGSITDQSSGAKGSPAISDESMTPWMEYLYMQQPKPEDATGVQVKLTATDADGDSQDIGTATSDTSGNYGIMWTPPAAGLYKITAMFSGTESYFGSDATTYIGVETAPSTSPVPTPTPTPPTPPSTTVAPTLSPSQPEGPGGGENTAIYVGIAAVAIIAVVAAAALVLRRRK